MDQTQQLKKTQTNKFCFKKQQPLYAIYNKIYIQKYKDIERLKIYFMVKQNH